MADWRQRPEGQEGGDRTHSEHTAERGQVGRGEGKPCSQREGKEEMTIYGAVFAWYRLRRFPGLLYTISPLPSVVSSISLPTHSRCLFWNFREEQGGDITPCNLVKVMEKRPTMTCSCSAKQVAYLDCWFSPSWVVKAASERPLLRSEIDTSCHL